MPHTQQIAVIGLGRFGNAVARDLAASGTDVIAIDDSQLRVDDVRDEVARPVCMDSTDRQAMLDQEIDEVDVAIVAIGEAFEAALLTTVLLKQFEVPRIVCRAQSELHAQIFRELGVDEVIQPEYDAGRNLARRLANPQIEDFMTLAENFILVELKTPSAFANKPLREINPRSEYGVNVVGIKRHRSVVENGETVQREYVINVPRPHEALEPDDILILVGSEEALAKLPRD